jgi:hypothetical protein
MSETNFDIIQKAAHYNQNLSGVECIQIIRSFDFNIGNSFKYLWRSDHKQNLLQDYKKALYYIKDELLTRKTKPQFIGNSKIPNIYKLKAYRERTLLIDTVSIYQYVESYTIPLLYHLLNRADFYIYDTHYLESAISYLSSTINNLEKTY